MKKKKKNWQNEQRFVDFKRLDMRFRRSPRLGQRNKIISPRRYDVISCDVPSFDRSREKPRLLSMSRVCNNAIRFSAKSIVRAFPRRPDIRVPYTRARERAERRRVVYDAPIICRVRVHTRVHEIKAVKFYGRRRDAKLWISNRLIPILRWNFVPTEPIKQ